MPSKKIYQNKYPYFVTINIKGRIPLFNDLRYTTIVSELIHALEERYLASILGYAIMPDHLHIFIDVGKKYNISQIMQHFKSLVYYNFRKRLNFKDKFWQRSFDYRIKESTQEIFQTISYIKSNPEKWQLPAYFHKKPYLFINEDKTKEILKIL